MKQIHTFKFLSHHYCCCCLAVVCLLLMTSHAASYSCDGAAPECSYKPAPRGGARGALNVYKPDNTWTLDRYRHCEAEAAGECVMALYVFICWSTVINYTAQTCWIKNYRLLLLSFKDFRIQ